MSEQPHEKHNRIAFEIAEKILKEFPKNTEKLLLLETIIAGTLSLMVKSMHNKNQRNNSSLKLFNVLCDGIPQRLDEMNAKGL